MSSCKNLEKLLERLDRLKHQGLNQTYYIPGIWDYKNQNSSDVIEIDPYEYLSNFIREYLITRVNSKVNDYLLPLSFYEQDKNWLAKGGIFCLDIRTATSWDHDWDQKIVKHNGRVTELGTFLKAFFLLPHIKNLNLNILYLLPVLKPGKSYSKGELGSFYAIKDFYQLNPDLHDPILDLPGDPFPIETEFKALIEACHILGIRVIFDFPLRTAARDNNLIKDHPDWFYWIKLDYLNEYRVPTYTIYEEHVQPTRERLQKIYTLPETKKYINMFSFPPNKVNEKAWKELLTEFEKDPTQNILELIEEKFGLTTAPAYSDWINDPQPSWDDITFLRLYLDEPSVREGFFDSEVPPFLFFDSIKTNLYPGNQPNTELWEYLTGIIRFYQENFGIDGARIDMAHALPEELEKKIMTKCLAFDPDFKFISEELQNSNHHIAHKKGYHSIIGENWWHEGHLNAENLVRLLKELPTLSVPSFACAETPDTPRAAIREGGRKFSRMIAVMNFFLPNTIPFINNGFELYERQPMNLGLDNTEEGRYVLDEDDLYYGRLAFFDRYQLHWLNDGVEEMVDLISKGQKLRLKYWSLISNLESFYVTGTIEKNLVQFGYRNEEMELICLVNLDFTKEKSINDIVGEVLISSVPGEITQKLRPGEFRVYLKK
ncbi:alpha-amylase [Anoxybacter fermentans]|nr:alpha-amylase [Anoxybacter fermentans]